MLAGVTVGGLWADGRQDAWLAGDECADPATCGNGDAGNGTRRRAALGRPGLADGDASLGVHRQPARPGCRGGGGHLGHERRVLAARGAGEVASTDALHLTGNGWAAPVRLDAAIQAAVAPSPTQLWAFGEPSWSGPPGYVAHFNGRTWTHGSFPFNGTATAARSASDVWVGGGGYGMAGLGIEHWNGRRWHATPLPDLGVPRVTCSGRPSAAWRMRGQPTSGLTSRRRMAPAGTGRARSSCAGTARPGPGSRSRTRAAPPRRSPPTATAESGWPP